MPRRVKAKEAAEFYSTSESNLRKWAREGRIPAERTPAGNFLYLIYTEEDEKKVKEEEPIVWTENIVYTRVSSKKQLGDLNRQAEFLSSKYPGYTVVKDVGSGINYKRKGFQSILERLFSGSVKKVVVAHQDRWSRFGFDFFQWLFSKFDAILEPMEFSKKPNGDDLVGDIMEIFTVFTARYYGRRKYGTSVPNPESKSGAKKFYYPEDSDFSDTDSEGVTE